MAATRFHRPELDVLRFGAFFLVFLHHALPHASAEYAVGGVALAAAGRSGALGVDLFFTLSAYLISELLLREQHAAGSIDIRSFYARRILRIWPLYFFALLVLAPLMTLIDASDRLPASYLAGFVLLSGNWACVLWGYPGSSFSLLWSVSIEEQFYLAWPWLVRWSARNLGAVIVAMIGIAWATRIALATAGTEHPGVWCNTLARLDPIAGGALLAWMLRGRTPVLTMAARAALLGSGGFLLLTAGAPGEHAGWGAVGTYPLAALACTMILYGTLGIGRRSPVFEYLGKISFGLYVFHAAALRVVEFAPAALLLTIGMASLSYRFIESPFLRWKQRLARVGSRPL
jgi:peptidoglycan/LPS O-acetylase OafA/YrhL